MVRMDIDHINGDCPVCHGDILLMDNGNWACSAHYCPFVLKVSENNEVIILPEDKRRKSFTPGESEPYVHFIDTFTSHLPMLVCADEREISEDE